MHRVDAVRCRCVSASATKKPQSRLEQRFLLYWQSLGGPVLEREYRFHPTRKWRADFAHVESRTLIEVEGGIYIAGGGRHNRAAGFLADLEKYLEAALAGFALPTQETEIVGWLEARIAEWTERSEILSAQALSLDRQWQQHGADLEGLLMDLRVSETMHREPAHFPPEDRSRIRALCDHLATPNMRSQLGGQMIVSLPELQRLIDSYRAKENRAPRKSQRLFGHIVRRLEDAVRVTESN
ncbi:MAG: hypothetical protein H7062_14350 [Candidatus Saccharimonas sp.]|nr:hypothetical protein [Planctomycetaceae bacterium]